MARHGGLCQRPGSWCETSRGQQPAHTARAAPRGHTHCHVQHPVGAACCRCVSADFAHGAGDQFDLGAMGSPPEDASVAEARARRQRGPPPTPLSDCLQVRPASPPLATVKLRSWRRLQAALQPDQRVLWWRPCCASGLLTPCTREGNEMEPAAGAPAARAAGRGKQLVLPQVQDAPAGGAICTSSATWENARLLRYPLPASTGCSMSRVQASLAWVNNVLSVQRRRRPRSWTCGRCRRCWWCT